MLNQCIIVGRVKKVNESERLKGVVITIYVNNIENNGENIKVLIKNGNLKDNFIQYVKLNDIVGIKGQLKNINNNAYVVCEKLTFLSSNYNNSNESEEL